MAQLTPENKKYLAWNLQRQYGPSDKKLKGFEIPKVKPPKEHKPK